jgi:hypothetical protein
MRQTVGNPITGFLCNIAQKGYPKLTGNLQDLRCSACLNNLNLQPRPNNSLTAKSFRNYYRSRIMKYPRNLLSTQLLFTLLIGLPAESSLAEVQKAKITKNNKGQFELISRQKHPLACYRPSATEDYCLRKS